MCKFFHSLLLLFGGTSSTFTPTTDGSKILLETGDAFLLETGDKLLIE